MLLYVRKDDARAEKHFRAATRLDPNYALAHRGLAGVLQKRGEGLSSSELAELGA